MQRARVELSPRARRDVDAVWEYLSQEVGKREADAWRKKLFASIRNLASFPQLGRLLDDPLNRSSSYRFIVSGNYLVFYRLENDAVRVDRIIHGSCDYIRTLFSDNEN